MVTGIRSGEANSCVCVGCSPGPSRFLCLRGLHTSRSECVVIVCIHAFMTFVCTCVRTAYVSYRRRNQLMDLVSKCVGIVTINFVGREQSNAVRTVIMLCVDQGADANISRMSTSHAGH